ncbi:MAG TPA: hypothetical protein ENN28_02795 [Candidatus Uhrbacteria bacterium]|nr:hypothetical protein [Candidatus Uhrbacteria bacterium]
MKINKKQFKKVRVETQSGQYLGKLCDFAIETDTGILEKYYVKSSVPIASLFENKLLVDKSQIISFDSEKMVVEDGVIEKKAGVKVFKKVENVEGIEPAITSERT